MKFYLFLLFHERRPASHQQRHIKQVHSRNEKDSINNFRTYSIILHWFLLQDFLHQTTTNSIDIKQTDNTIKLKRKQYEIRSIFSKP